MTEQKSESFGVRLDGAELARLDAYAAAAGRKRGWAAARAIAAGLDALEGAAPVVTAAPGATGLDVSALARLVAAAVADAVGERLATSPAAVPAVAPSDPANAARDWPPGALGDALQGLHNAAVLIDERVPPAMLRKFLADTLTELGAECPPAPRTSKPRPGGRRRNPSDPPDRRDADRLTDADVGRWVHEGPRRVAHRLAHLGSGGVGHYACGQTSDLRYTVPAPFGARRCARCEPQADPPGLA